MKLQTSTSRQVVNETVSAEPLNQQELGAICALAASSVIGLYLLSAFAGAVLSFIRRG
ncbi:hypothetical protein [Robbsia andropogonis]|uniref:hypothetical protein n=1 Tax=Robbsia andropogonis TaxID=28092 RepID=UPI000A572A2D|nr:hypothetical protein [Robbsia andropogonis]